MPITRKQFDLGITDEIEDLMRDIHRYLFEHKDEAFSVEDLGEYFEVDDITGESWRNLRIALMKLAELEAAEKRTIGGEEFYTYVGELEDI